MRVDQYMNVNCVLKIAIFSRLRRETAAAGAQNPTVRGAKTYDGIMVVEKCKNFRLRRGDLELACATAPKGELALLPLNLGIGLGSKKSAMYECLSTTMSKNGAYFSLQLI